MLSTFTAGVMWQALCSEDNVTKMQNMFMLFSFGFMDKTSIVGWITSFGDGAELLEPSEFREDIVAFADGIRKKYL